MLFYFCEELSTYIHIIYVHTELSLIISKCCAIAMFVAVSLQKIIPQSVVPLLCL